MTRPRRLSQAISEGDGISVLVHVADAAAAAAAEAQGADGVVLDTPAAGLRKTTSLPILSCGASPTEAHEASADAWLLVAEGVSGEGAELEALYRRTHELGLECVVDVHDEEELEGVLDRIDPEIFLLSPREADNDEEALDRVLELLPDVPAGKLAVADLRSATKGEVEALERAGVDAVLVDSGNVADLVGGQVPEV